MTRVGELVDLINQLIKQDTQNFYFEVQMGNGNTGKDFTDFIKKARVTNDRRGKLKNQIDDCMSEILKENNIKLNDEPISIAESFGFLIDRAIIAHLKVWFSEEEIRKLNLLDSPDPSVMEMMVNNSRQDNNSRITLQELLERKILLMIEGRGGVGERDPKFFQVDRRK